MENDSKFILKTDSVDDVIVKSYVKELNKDVKFQNRALNKTFVLNKSSVSIKAVNNSINF